MTKIEPCPCGAPARLVAEDARPVKSFVLCSAPCCWVGPPRDTNEEAIAEWNRVVGRGAGRAIRKSWLDEIDAGLEGEKWLEGIIAGMPAEFTPHLDIDRYGLRLNSGAQPNGGVVVLWYRGRLIAQYVKVRTAFNSTVLTMMRFPAAMEAPDQSLARQAVTDAGEAAP